MKVVHCKEEPYDIYIGRGSKWGNPFIIDKDGDRLEVIQKYEEYLVNNKKLLDSLYELKGKTLGCYCSPKPCHGDILIKHVNRIMNKFKVVIFGSRSFNDYNLLRDKCRFYLKRYIDFDYKIYTKNPNLEILSGKAPGADTLGETWAINTLISVKPFPADWKNIDTEEPCVVRYNQYNQPYNALAGHNRNKAMAEYANAGIGFDMGTSGTKNMIEQLYKLNKPVRIVRV